MELGDVEGERYVVGLKEVERQHVTSSGKGGLALKLPRAAWVSQETVKISKTQSALGSHRSKSTWNSIFRDSQRNSKALSKSTEQVWE